MKRHASPLAAVAALAATLGLAVAGDAIGGTDLHAYWDDRCRSCHGDAGEFARRTLKVEGGRLQGAHHRDDLDRFLRNHYLTDELVAPVSAMLAAQASSPPTFGQRCAGCHGPASAFARESLRLRDGVLVGKDSGQPVQTFLRGHGGLPAASVPAMAATLRRVYGEVGGS